MGNNILVSVGVITYNSSKYVLETLESIKAQTYQNIELIISDDCSTDNTIELCRKWVENNQNRFVKTEIITVPQNTGIPANCNRFIKTSQGKWIKLIAGDDILERNSIEDYVNFVSRTDCNVVFAKAKEFSDLFDNGKIYPTESQIKYFNISASDQHKILLKQNFPISPTLFIKRFFLFEMNLFDEKYPGAEDYPLWLKITDKGEKLFLMNKVTVMYRISLESATRTQTTIVNVVNYRTNKAIYYDKIRPELSVIKDTFFIWSKFVYFFKVDVALSILPNKNNFLSKLIFRIGNLLDPLYYFSLLNKVKK